MYDASQANAAKCSISKFEELFVAQKIVLQCAYHIGPVIPWNILQSQPWRSWAWLCTLYGNVANNWKKYCM